MARTNPKPAVRKKKPKSPAPGESAAPARKRRPHPAAASARALALDIAASLEGNKCADVLVLDLRDRSPITDYFVIASGTSDRQMHAACEHVVELAEARSESLYRSNLDAERSDWLILDFVDVVVHVLMPEARRHYDIEMLWGDAPRLRRPALDPPKAESKRNRAGLTDADVLPDRTPLRRSKR